ncbi:type I-C CRISPR-associated protein Cas8c/Csd1 [Melissospora conviva]|uniref:type I-C CRISPR-associated protein Cas8c/Csd1 n=1 Tax=Melissospora conviva TaxID=3388432 RepID=UPI003B7BE0FD
MLLQRLVEYRSPDSEDESSRSYSRTRTVRWQLDLSPDGKMAELVDLADPSEKATKFGKAIRVPNGGRTSGIAPAIGADDAQYVLGWCDAKSKPDRVAKAHKAFVELSRRWLREHPDDHAAQAVVAFYDQGDPPSPRDGDKWSSKDLVIIAVGGNEVTDSDSLWSVWKSVVEERKSGSGARSGFCLVCGKRKPLLDRMPQALPKALVPRAEQEIALISANKRIHTYDHVEGLAGSPICVDCGQAAVANLHAILSDERSTFTYERQRTRLAWWVTRDADSDTIRLLDERPDRIGEYLHSLATGRQRRKPSGANFCSVTISGNVARLMVHQWLDMPLEQAEDNVAAWFRDHKIMPRGQDRPAGYPIWLLVTCSGQWVPDNSPRGGRYIPMWDKAADRPDDLAHLLLQSGLHRNALPPHLLAHVVRRVRADLHLDGPRAALLRVALTRMPGRSGGEPAAVLDETQDHPAYLYGRIFATLESLQTRAYGQKNLPNATFFHRYFSGAVANPRVAIVQGIQLMPAWLKKLDSAARETGGSPEQRVLAEKAARAARRYRSAFKELYDRLQAPPAPLNDAESQSWFVMGYFHQQAHDSQAARSALSWGEPTTAPGNDTTTIEGTNQQ